MIWQRHTENLGGVDCLGDAPEPEREPQSIWTQIDPYDSVYTDEPERVCQHAGCPGPAEVNEELEDERGNVLQWDWCLEHARLHGYEPPDAALYPRAPLAEIAEKLESSLARAEQSKSFVRRAEAFGELRYWLKVLKRQSGRAA